MKILGFDIKVTKAQVHVEPNPGSAGVSLVKAVQKTEDSVPLKKAFPRAELGDSGTQMMHGIITEEYLSNLQGIAGVKVYDEMRRSDGTVRAAMMVTTLPIRRAQWFVNPAIQDDAKSKEIAAFVEHALFDWIDITWDDILRQALLMVPFGVMTFEKVYGTHDHNGKTFVTLKKLAPRLPKSIMQWELPDRTFGIQQVRQDGVIANIPGSKLLIFVNEREGDNWWGTSMLRAAYKHWYHKNNFYKIDAIAFERQGVGVPKITMPVGYTEADERKATNAMMNLRANEKAYLVLPPDYTAEFMNMGASTTRDPEKSIQHHNREIVKSVLAQFLELGATQVGSKALSEDHSDLFLKSLEAIANTVLSEINRNLIPELVDMNFDDVEIYPQLDYSGITRTDMVALGNAYAQLVTAKGINPTKDDEQYIRTVLGLPARSQDDNDDPSSEDIQDGADIESEDDEEAETEEVDNAVDNSKQKKETPENNKQVKDKVAKAHEHKKLARKFEDGKGFKSWRPLTFAEGQVDWSKLQNTINEMEASFTQDATAALQASKDVFMKKLHKALEDGDIKAITDLETNFVLEYKLLIKDAVKKAYEFGKEKVAAEMHIVTPPNSAASLAQIDLAADAVANKMAADIEAKAKLQSISGMKTEQSILQTVGAIDLLLEEAIRKGVENTSDIIIAQGINIGRNDVFTRNADKIYALQRSEVLDEVTCNFCLSMDGKVIDVDDKWSATDIYHSNCRGIWVQILKDEVDPPEITGIPDELGDYYGGTTNQLVQPKKPI
jgi:hypothetical protein